jgi:hypothetical protein
MGRPESSFKRQGTTPCLLAHMSPNVAPAPRWTREVRPPTHRGSVSRSREVVYLTSLPSAVGPLGSHKIQESPLRALNECFAIWLAPWKAAPIPVPGPPVSPRIERQFDRAGAPPAPALSLICSMPPRAARTTESHPKGPLCGAPLPYHQPPRKLWKTQRKGLTPRLISYIMLTRN